MIGGEWRVGVGHHLPPTNESGTSNMSPCSHLQPSQTIHPPLVPVAPYLGHSADPSSLRNPTDSHPCLPGVVTVKNPPKKTTSGCSRGDSCWYNNGIHLHKSPCNTPITSYNCGSMLSTYNWKRAPNQLPPSVITAFVSSRASYCLHHHPRPVVGSDGVGKKTKKQHPNFKLASKPWDNVI